MMKNMIRHKAKSALSILLTICVLLSCVSVGIISTSAAEADVAGTGWPKNNTYKIGNDISGKWNGSGANMTSVSDTKKTYTFYLTSTDTDVYYRFYDNNQSKNIVPDGGAGIKVTTDGVKCKNGESNEDCFYFDTADLSGSDYYKVNINFNPQGGGTGDNEGNPGWTWYDKTSIANIVPTVSTKSPNYVKGNTVELQTTYTGSNIGTLSYKYEYKLSTASDWSTATNGQFTASSAGVYNARVTVTDAGAVVGTNARTARKYTSSAINITVKNNLETPSFTLSRTTTGDVTTDNVTSANKSDTITVNVTNYASLSTYCDFVPKVGGVAATYTDNKDGTFTITGLNSSANGTDNLITLTATVKEDYQDSYTFSGSNSSTSDQKTLKIYEPVYSLAGNVDGTYISGSTASNQGNHAAGTQEYKIDWWLYYQPTLAVNTETATPGVYSITFDTTGDLAGHDDIEIGLVDKGATDAIADDVQRAFYDKKNLVYYNEAGNDYQMSAEGIKDTDQIYLNQVAATNGGGAIAIHQNTHVTLTINQTENSGVSGAPNGQITVATDTHQIFTEGKYQDFDIAADDYDTIGNAGENIGTTSVTPSIVKAHTNYTLIATPGDGYEFEGWYSDASCTTTKVADVSHCLPEGDSFAYTVVGTDVPTTDSKTYYAKFLQIKPAVYGITTGVITGGEAAITGGTIAGSTATSATAYEGADVTITCTVTNDAKYFVGWNVLRANGSKITVTNSSTSGAVTTGHFTMPGSAVIVSAILADKPKATVTVGTNPKDESMGTATLNSPAAGTNIYLNETEIEATAAPKTNYAFTGWTISGAKLVDDSKLSDLTITVQATSNKVELTANFDYKEYIVYYSDGSGSLPMIRQEDGTYISAGKVPDDYNFIIKDVYGKTYGLSKVSSATDVFWINTTNSEGEIASWNTTLSKPFRNDYGSAKYVVFDPSYTDNTSLGLVTLSSSYAEGVTMANVYTKEGAIRADGSSLFEDGGYTSAIFATSTLVTSINDKAVTASPKAMYATSYGHHYEIPMESHIIVETKLTANSIKEHWYVSHFVVNGWKVAATKMKEGVYTASIDLDNVYAMTAPANPNVANAYEITPVVYNSDIEADGGYTTFYVDADYVPSVWETDTLSVQSYYAGATKTHYTGTYPGVPMARVGKYYEIKVPLYYYAYDNTDKVMEKDSAHPVSSITITGFTADDVNYHIKYGSGSFWANNKNFQTYDYGDFKEIAQIPNVQSILFRPMFNTNGTTYVNNTDTDGHWDQDGTVNKFQLLTDYYGNPVDAFGHRIPKDGGGYYTAADAKDWSAASNAAVKIVSIGDWDNQNNSGNSPTVASLDGINAALQKDRTEGHWVTRWRAFVKNGTKFERAAVGTAADFIDTTPDDASPTVNVKYYKDSGRTTYSASDLDGKITYVSYEGEYHNEYQYGNTKDTGRRIDGQWYYSSLGKEFESNVKVGLTSDGTVDYEHVTIADNSNTTNTGFIGTINESELGTAKLNDKTTATFTNVTSEATLDFASTTDYTFVGWYIKDGTTYTKIGDNYMDLNTSILMNNTYTIVAVVKAVPEGSLVITHSKYTGNNPVAHDGTGKYYISAKVYNHDGTLKQEYAEKQNSLPVEITAEDKLEISIRTKCNGIDRFYAWYEEELDSSYKGTGRFYEIGSEDEDPFGQNQVGYTFSRADCAKFFDAGTLKKKSIDIYSDITHVSASANITYQYNDRFSAAGTGKMVQYVVKNIELDTDEIENGYIPTDDKIQRYAPTIVDTIFTDTKWVLTEASKVERQPSNILVTATQEVKDCSVQYVDFEDVSVLLTGESETAVDKVSDWINVMVPFNSWVTNKDADYTDLTEDDFTVKAPKTIEMGDDVWNFVRFDVYAVDRNTGEIGEKIFTCNDSTFGYRIFADCAIYPVYALGEIAPTLTATINPPVFNHEIYGDSMNPVDRLYADLLIAYINSSSVNSAIPEVIKANNPAESGYDIETGVILDRSVNLSDEDYETLKAAAIQGDEDTTTARLEKYKSSLHSAVDVDNLAKDGTNDGTLFKRYINDNNILTNKNRFDKVFTFNNSATTQHRVMAAYSYVIIRDHSDNSIVAYAKSEPQYFNFAYYGNVPLGTSGN